MKLRTVQRSSSKTSITNMAFSPDSKTLAWEDGGDVRLLALETLREQAVLKDVGGCFTFSPDGKTLAVRHERKVDLWNIATRSDSLPGTAQSSHLWTRLLSQTTLLATASVDGTIKLWELTNRTEVSSLVLQEKSPSRLVFSPDGTPPLAVARPGMAFEIPRSEPGQ